MEHRAADSWDAARAGTTSLTTLDEGAGTMVESGCKRSWVPAKAGPGAAQPGTRREQTVSHE